MKNAVTLLEAAEINPPLPKERVPLASDQVAFVPMAQVGEDGSITSVVSRPFSEVSKGFTQFYENDVLLAKITPCMENGKAAMVNGLSTLVGCGSTEYHVLRARKGTWPRYLFHSVWNEPFRNLAARNMTGSAGQKRVPRSFLESHKIPLPPLTEQKRIAAILDKADAIRRKLQQSLRLSDDFLRSVFLDMFGNPVFSSKVKTVVKVADAGEVQLGRQRAPKYQSGRHTCPYVRVANVYENRISTKDVLSMDFNTSDFKKYRLEEGDILLNEGQSTELVGRPAMWRNEIPNCCFQNTLVRFKAKKEVVEPYYALFLFLHYLWYGRFANLSSKTSSVAHLGAARFAEMPFPLPDLASQKKFAMLAEKTYRSQVRLRAQASEAEALFSTLQQRAFRGEL
jgi:type I restriction enzyme S subunit